MDLRPWEYWRMTPEEFAAVAHGYAVRRAREYERSAWVVAHLLAPYRKRGGIPITPQSLLGPQVRVLLNPSVKPVAKDDE